MYHHGLVVGKFAPFHMGHAYLINTALKHCDHVTVCVVDSPVAGVPPATVRASWINEHYVDRRGERPRVLVMEDIRNDDNSEYWAEYTKFFLGFTPDAVFTSEDYGDPWAKALGCEHFLVDPLRRFWPTSGTSIRENPRANLRWLPPVVRAFYTPVVAVVGAESTGTTTLANDLANHYGTVAVPEYGRLRDERRVEQTGKPYDWPHEDFMLTAVMQQAMIDKAKRTREGRGLVIADTDALATYLWEERYLGERSRELAKYAFTHYSDLYIVTSHEGVEEEEDGLRFEMEKRPKMTRDFSSLLLGARPFRVVKGSPEERLEQAVHFINKELREDDADFRALSDV